MSKPDVLQGYAAEAAALIPRFEELRTRDVLAPVAALLPARPSRVLDIGAGTGRDAAWFADRGHHVVAVEPVDAFRQAGMALHPSERIAWVKDTLPALARLRSDPRGYDLVLVIAVWQHLPRQEHRHAIGALADKVAPRGRLILSLRHGPGSASRPCHPADAERIVAYAKDAGLELRLRRSAASVQQRNRDLGVTWTWLCFERP
jgi:SAM-dependent methyltransferase